MTRYLVQFFAIVLLSKGTLIAQSSSDEGKLICVEKLWILDAQKFVQFVQEGDSVRLTDYRGLAVASFEKGESIRQVVISPDKSRLLILAEYVKASGRVRPIKYSRLVMVWTDFPNKLTSTDLLKAEDPAMKDRWIVEINSVSNDGKSIGLTLFGDRVHSGKRTINPWEFNPFHD